MADTLDLCARYTDASSLEALIPRLIPIIRRGIGLNTKYDTAPKTPFPFQPKRSIALYAWTSSVAESQEAHMFAGRVMVVSQAKAV